MLFGTLGIGNGNGVGVAGYIISVSSILLFVLYYANVVQPVPLMYINTCFEPPKMKNLICPSVPDVVAGSVVVGVI
jgi:hypothetical protein